jgi:hypothetical protein
VCDAFIRRWFLSQPRLAEAKDARSIPVKKPKGQVTTEIVGFGRFK